MPQDPRQGWGFVYLMRMDTNALALHLVHDRREVLPQDNLRLSFAPCFDPAQSVCRNLQSDTATGIVWQHLRPLICLL